ncbi:hypothetical protein M3599_23425 [Niallia circulans]|uniref:hypothetical protein n=1 Tax=Niallia circulans TaxID=1397 RepID=UPI00203AEF92|nr:hypothetical protein [Niallia circulans]MCM2983849.1 hypothetical protein [Niallia circulans]
MLEKRIKELEKIILTTENKVADLEVKISALVQTISSLQVQKVNKDEIVDALNKSSSDIRIKGNKIHIDRNTLIEHDILS